MSIRGQSAPAKTAAMSVEKPPHTVASARVVMSVETLASSHFAAPDTDDGVIRG
jgi:hypothetical protein